MLLLSAVAGLIVAGARVALAASATYECSDGTTLSAGFAAASHATGKVDMRCSNGRLLTLPQVVSADGGRYGAGDVEFWIKGKGATLTRGGNAQSCSAH